MSGLELHGLTSPFQRLRASDGIMAAAVLEDRGRAVGTDAGSVDLCNISFLELHGPTHPFQRLQASYGVSSLAVLDDKGLGVSTNAGYAYSFSMPDVAPHGSTHPLPDFCKQVMVSSRGWFRTTRNLQLVQAQTLSIHQCMCQPLSCKGHLVGRLGCQEFAAGP